MRSDLGRRTNDAFGVAELHRLSHFSHFAPMWSSGNTSLFALFACQPWTTRYFALFALLPLTGLEPGHVSEVRIVRNPGHFAQTTQRLAFDREAVGNVGSFNRAKDVVFETSGAATSPG